jgi:hypothetical protein
MLYDTPQSHRRVENERMKQLVAVLGDMNTVGGRRGFIGLLRLAVRPFVRLWRLAESHQLNPWVFIAMSVAGYLVQAMVFLPPFQTHAWKLAFLVLLRVIALVVPTYIFFKGKRIAAAFNVSVIAMFIFNTTWHICYYVYA